MPLTPLPIDNHLPSVIKALGRSPNLVLVADPGAGKTTRVPPAVLGAELLAPAHQQLIMLQPRRVAARASAARIAEEQRWTLGREVGYHVRFDNRTSRETRLRVVTEGILTRRLQSDPYLEGVGCVVLDEFHERSIHTDLAIALLRELQHTARDDLRLVVMSATLDAEPLATFLAVDGAPAPILRVPGRPYAVAVTHATQPLLVGARDLPERVADALQAMLADPADDDGDVLIFLPGGGEIYRSISACGHLARSYDLDLFALHGSLPAEEQDRALRPGARRRVIFATNIAETSLTIDGVSAVIDTGMARVLQADPRTGVDRLELVRISKASATQRAGRAGRQRAGRCHRLWTQHEHTQLRDFESPEIHRADLAGTVLTLAAWGTRNATQFGWFDRPADARLAAASHLLRQLDAIDVSGQLTAIGRRMLTFPAHPRIARLLVAGEDYACIPHACTLAALLSEKDILTEPPAPSRGQAECDLTRRALALADAERRSFAPALAREGFDLVTCRQVARVRDEFIRMCAKAHQRHNQSRTPNEPRPSGSDPQAPDGRVVLLAAFPDRVARRRDPREPKALMVGGRGVTLDPTSAVQHAELFVAIDIRDQRRLGRLESTVYAASAIERAWLEWMFPGSLAQRTWCTYDEGSQSVTALRASCYHDLPLASPVRVPGLPSAVSDTLAEALAPRAGELIQADQTCSEVLARISFLRAAMPELSWPSFDAQWQAMVVREACLGCSSLAEVKENGFAQAIERALGSEHRRALEQHAPRTLAVPSGSRIKVDYFVDKPPVLAVRLQEVFGLMQTPKLAGGRVAVVMHLLGPNYRPVQITADLASFWATGYPKVRKDLRARYPKHAWPDDPTTATPQAKGGRRFAG